LQNGQVNGINTAIDWCLTATEYASSLVGVEIGGGLLGCIYENGSINDIKLTDFSPTATNKITNFSGTGAVAEADGLMVAVLLSAIRLR
jgi:hypothetical protein